MTIKRESNYSGNEEQYHKDYPDTNCNNVIEVRLCVDGNRYMRITETINTQQEWYQVLAETANTVSNEIHKRNLRAGANWMVTSPDVASIFESTATYRPNATFDPSEIQYSMGIEKSGTVSNRYTLYKDPYFPVNKVLLGYKGPGFIDAGYVYAPYVPLVFTPTIFDPNDLTPRKGALTRYAKQMIRPEYYGTITVVDLNVVGSQASV